MNEEYNSKLKKVVMLVESDSTNITTIPESKNLESILWYLGELRSRVIKENFPNGEEFIKSSLIAEKSLSQLISSLNKK